jgi:hypothetical protein
MKDKYAARFFLLAFIITWGAWGLLILLGKDIRVLSCPCLQS